MICWCKFVRHLASVALASYHTITTLTPYPLPSPVPTFILISPHPCVPQCKVCRSCFLVYRTLDKAREAASGAMLGRPPSQRRPRQDLSKSVPASYKQQLEEKREKERLKVGIMYGPACVCVSACGEGASEVMT